ncbi:response regulator [Skermanella mucosa]|uniref:hybrid sensor histidine kinase/response regulator n=1 Tax=Skermanella mucosa TaxID=1789672 RepID=UPI00192C23F1|nr:ATP-binding protein [Skermanella mucosa]UEM21812.1 response regulator [Skermanella mucosa]
MPTGVGAEVAGPGEPMSRPSVLGLARGNLLIIGIVAIAASLAMAVAIYLWQRQGLIAEAELSVHAKAEEFARTVSASLDAARRIPSTLRRAELDALDGDDARRVFFAASSASVADDPQITGVFLGFRSGAFWQATDLMPRPLEAEFADRWDPAWEIRRVIEPGSGATWTLRLKDGHRVEAPDASGYDPRTRPWFQAASAAGAGSWTEPYRFSSSGKDGITFAAPLRSAGGEAWSILGIDMTLDRLREGLERAAAGSLPPGGAIAVIPAGSGGGAPLATHATRSADPGWRGIVEGLAAAGPGTRTTDDYRHIAAVLPVAEDLRFPYVLALLYPTSAVIGPADAQLRTSLILLGTASAVMSVIVVYAFRLRREVAARRAAERELVEANADLAKARDEAEAATRAKSSFLAMMSHEIRTPMNGVMAMAEMLDQTDLSDDQRDMSSLIRTSAAALLTIINDILDFSKIEAGKLDLETIPFDPLDLIEGVGELLVAKAEEKGIVLSVEADARLPRRLTGDPTRLRQVLLNLGGNAVKFTDRGGVVLKLVPLGADSGSWWRFEVVDSGIGLTAEQQGRLFTAFQQADGSTTRRFGGTGLGLAICRKMVDMMGGRIGVASVPGEGSVFWFEVPPEIAEEEPLRPAFPAAGLSVLALDVHPLRQSAIRSHLEAAGVGRHAFRRSDGLDAAEIAADPPSVVLLDAGDNSDHAFALHHALAGELPGVPWALLCSRGLASTLGAAADEGFFAKLTHSVRRERLFNVVGAAAGLVPLEERRTAAGDEFSGWRPPDGAEAEAAGVLILVAEDNATNQTVIRKVLGDMGFAHDIVDNGRLALEALDRRRYGLLLTDFHMPEMDGFQLTAAVRARETGDGARLPIVALTADALPGTAQHCLESGMDGYLTKPIERRAMAGEIARFLPRALDLRERTAAQAAPAAPRPRLDPAIFDIGRINDVFGGFDADARAMLAGFLDRAAELAADVERALGAGDPAAARDSVHMLKGAAASVGAVRLGGLAGDIQDCLDGGDADTAGFLASMLDPTVAELRGTVDFLVT